MSFNQNQNISSSEWQQFWGEFAETSYDHVGLFPENKKMLSYISSLVGSNNNVLDAGCGSGNLTTKLAQSNAVTGVDFSKEMLLIAKEKTKNQNVQLYEGDVTDLHFQDKTFDVITSVNVIFNLENPEKAFREANRLLQNHGRFIVSCPSAEAQLTQDLIHTILNHSKDRNLDQKQTVHLLDMNKKLYEKGGMKFKPTASELKKLFEQNGFEVRRIETIYYGMNHLYEGIKKGNLSA